MQTEILPVTAHLAADANYSIKWERWDFDVKNGFIDQAYLYGPEQTGEWNLNIRVE